MKLDDSRRSDNVEDERGAGFGRRGAGIGIGTIVIVVVGYFMGVSPSTLLSLLNGGDNWTSRIHVDDLAETLIAAMERAKPSNVYLATDDLPVIQRDFFKEISAAAGVPMPLNLETNAARAFGVFGRAMNSLSGQQQYQLSESVIGLLTGNYFCVNDRIKTELGVKLETSADVVHHPYLRQFSAFFDALRDGREMPLTSLADAAKTFEIIFAADRSAELGRPVQLSELYLLIAQLIHGAEQLFVLLLQLFVRIVGRNFDL